MTGCQLLVIGNFQYIYHGHSCQQFARQQAQLNQQQFVKCPNPNCQFHHSGAMIMLQQQNQKLLVQQIQGINNQIQNGQFQGVTGT